MNIKTNNLTKKYGGKTVFENLSLNLDFSGILIVKGASGCGKTTLMKIIAGLEDFDGNISVPTDKISFMFQEDRLIPFISVLKNVSAVSDAETAKKYLTELGLSGEFDSPPSSLSGGMKRRVSLARALAYNSELVILDEPFKGLDEKLKQKTVNLIKKESQKRDFIIVTHESFDESLLGGKIIKVMGAEPDMV